ncbi:hypothetical protein PIB30_086109 [Stylosanthes scabra]|uniref:Uncharacterized protein n=1 Tax=Stylosanthes scabra TaxID=79078 RepID=A0ABU6STD3_9FABA|nr:hypothetical protein [Stylosanthes scabra]
MMTLRELEVNEGIHGINFPASGNSELSVVKGVKGILVFVQMLFKCRFPFGKQAKKRLEVARSFLSSSILVSLRNGTAMLQSIL